jgi:hypothetical protein
MWAMLVTVALLSEIVASSTRDIKDLLHVDAIVGGFSFALGVAAAGQAIRGNGDDERWFGNVAAPLLVVAAYALARASVRNAQSAARIVSVAAAPGLFHGGVHWWATLAFIATAGYVSGLPHVQASQPPVHFPRRQ